MTGGFSVQCPCATAGPVFHAGIVRVFSASGDAYYGCVKGSTRRVYLWRFLSSDTTTAGGSIEQVRGRFVAAEASSESQYSSDRSSKVFDLRSGASYAIAVESAPIFGAPTGDPPTPGPFPLERFIRGPDGRAVRLYDTYSSSARMPTVTGQVLELVGFNNLRHQLATRSPGVIAPASLTYDGRKVTWTQNGLPHSASV
jgi:hypothetical protein